MESGLDESVARRIDYSFRLFCSIYGFAPAEDNESAQVTLCYGERSAGPSHLSLYPGYEPRPLSTPAPKPVFIEIEDENGTMSFPVFHGLDDRGEPDWLGEIFEWVSGAHEHSITERNVRGDIPFSATLHGRYDLSPEVPYAAIAMQRLNAAIKEKAGEDWPDKPRKPWDGASSCVFAATHDLDFFPVNKATTIKRYLKNAAIAVLLKRNLLLALSILLSPFKALKGGIWLHNSLEKMYERERQLGIESSLYVIPRRVARRDANYEIYNPALLRFLKRLYASGVEIGVHGSCTSLASENRLAEEYERLAEHGFPAVGGRQHLLHFKSATLFKELMKAGAWYECSCGYNTRVGFRQGLCFPYPPYNFDSEAPFPLLELPLAVMDVALYSRVKEGEKAIEAANNIISLVKKYGWGGCSISWHDTVISGVQLPREIADAYWELKNPDDWWTSGKKLAETIWEAYRPCWNSLGG